MLAAYLGRRGYEVDLYERRADPREGNIVGGRSINLAISTRGIHALEQIGIADEALRHAIPMRGRMIHDRSGELHFSPHDVDPKNVLIRSGGRRSTQRLSKRHSAIPTFVCISITSAPTSISTPRLLIWKLQTVPLPHGATQ